MRDMERKFFYRCYQALLVFFALFLGGCFADAHVSGLNEQARPPYGGKVFLTELPLPRPSEFEFVGKVEVSGDLTDSRDTVLSRIANIARNLGANAVVEVKTWKTRSVGVNHHARGKAVIVNNRTLAMLNGEWR